MADDDRGRRAGRHDGESILQRVHAAPVVVLCSGWQRKIQKKQALRPMTRVKAHEKCCNDNLTMSKLHVVGVRRHVVGDVRQRRQVELLLLRGEAVGRRRLR